MTVNITPGDSFRISVSGLDSTFNNSVVIFKARQGKIDQDLTAKVNVLSNFENATLLQPVGTVNFGTIEIDFLPEQTANLSVSSNYVLEAQFIKTDGGLKTYFFEVKTTNNFISLVDEGTPSTVDYSYLGQLANEPLTGNEGEIYYNTTSNNFWVYINGFWQESSSISSLPDNLNTIFAHVFNNRDNLTLDGIEVLSVTGSGSLAFDADSTPVVGSQDYRGELVLLSDGTAGVKGGIYGGKNASLDISNYPDFVYVGVFKWDYDNYDRPSFDVLTQFTNDDGSTFTYTSTIQLGWTTQAGIFFDWDSTDPFGRNSIEDKNVHTLILTRNAGDIRIYVDGVLCRKDQLNLDTTPIPASGISYGGLLQPAGVKAVGSDQMIQLEHSFFENGISDSQAVEIDNFYKSKIKEYKSDSKLAEDLWLYIGNSIGAGFFYGNSGKTPAILTMKELDETYNKPQTRWHNLSEGGITTPQINADLDTHYKPFVSQTTGICRFLVHEGTNHIEVGGATSGQQVYDALKEFSDAVKAEGVAKGVTVEVYIGTILPRNTFDAGEEAIRQSANTLIRNNAATDGYILVDFETNPNLTNASNTTYFSDGIHLQIAGAEELASTWASVIDNNI